MRLILLLFLALHFSCWGAPLSVREQARYLQIILRQADDAYYNRDESVMSDEAYDALRAQYGRLRSRYPEIGAVGGVGAPVGNIDQRVGHSSAVLSLKKAYSDEDVKSFLSTCGEEQLYCVEPKIDGLSLVLRYHEGLLVKAITRGDGKTGSDVTAALLASGAVPAQLDHSLDLLEVRGELFIPYIAFEELNRRRVERGESLLKSSRNTAAGTLRLKDFSEISRRGLEFFVFELLATESMPSAHTEALALARSAGLQTVESQVVAASEVVPSVDELNQRRGSFPFATDGIVIRLDDRIAFSGLGTTAHHPIGALARKYKAVPVETRLLSVEWKRGATGRLTPVACFGPIEMEGATVQRASLHSLEHVRALDIRLGDWVQVIRAGGSIPEIVGVNVARRTGEEQPVPGPTNP